ncbi:MAG TPA: OB-fold domain-containing protein [Streptosporangiales bacterium]
MTVVERPGLAESLDPDALVAEARAFLDGRPGPLRTGRDPVNLPMVHHWCQALGDANPAYLDEGYARSSRRGHLIAPPGMLQTWIMDAPRDPDDPGPNDEVLRRVDAAGYTSVVAVNYEHEYLRELRHGERIGVRSYAEDLSEEKTTALGRGYFTTVRYEYLTDDGELVGIGRMRMLKFRPPPPKPSVGERVRPAVNRDNAYFWEGVAARELRIQRCGGCGVLRHPPAPVCAGCGSTDQGYVVAAGTGRVYSHVTHHHPPLPGVVLPHTVLLVELDEGVRLVSELAAGEDHGRVRIGLPVRLDFQEVPGGQLLPVFRPAEAP